MSRARLGQAAQNNRPHEEMIKFVHIWAMDVREFDQFDFNDDFFGPIFATVHADCALRWRLLVKPKGGQYTDSEIEFRTSVGIFLELIDPIQNVVASFKCMLYFNYCVCTYLFNVMYVRTVLYLHCVTLHCVRTDQKFSRLTNSQTYSIYFN